MTKRTVLHCLTLVASLFAPATAWAQSPEPVIEPQIDRRIVRFPKIDATDVEIGLYSGILSVEDFGAESSSGWRLGFHVTEDFFIEATQGRSTVSDQSFRQLGIAILNSQQVELTYRYLSVGFNLFPGEAFVGKGWAMTSAVYLIGGVGNVNFNREDHTAYNFGLGIRVLPFDWISLRFEMRNHLFESDLLGKNELKNNFEMTLGLAAYF